MSDRCLDRQLDRTIQAAALALVVVVEEVAVERRLHDAGEPHDAAGIEGDREIRARARSGCLD